MPLKIGSYHIEINLNPKNIIRKIKHDTEHLAVCDLLTYHFIGGKETNLEEINHHMEMYHKFSVSEPYILHLQKVCDS